MSPTPERSLDATYAHRLAEGTLSYQRCGGDHAVFPPRLVCPTCGSRKLTWTDASGDATIYSTTTISPRDAAPYSVVVLDTAEGFRMMSRLDGDDATIAQIGDRVRIEIRPLADGGNPLPCAVLTTTDVSA